MTSTDRNRDDSQRPTRRHCLVTLAKARTVARASASSNWKWARWLARDVCKWHIGDMHRLTQLVHNTLQSGHECRAGSGTAGFDKPP
jgi:hypothetical protein